MQCRIQHPHPYSPKHLRCRALKHMLTTKSCKLLLNPLSANPTKWSTNTFNNSSAIRQTIRQTIRGSVFDHFMGLALKTLKIVPF